MCDNPVYFRKLTVRTSYNEPFFFQLKVFFLFLFFSSTFTTFNFNQIYTYNSKIYISKERINNYSYLHVRTYIQHIYYIYIILVIPFFFNDRF